ncbi:MAG: hypothetical protein QY306_10650 [Anaerolineales bacterium]|nr:MAG: hypothetical protein QY306_10650 [Anaerolineales bacterium]
MAKQSNQKLLQEYKERNTRWTDRTLSQMSFYNNLLLTLGIGFLSFAYQDSKLLNLELSLKDIDRSLIAYVFSIISVGFSILTGLMASISRLYDFSITRQINLIRQRALEFSRKKINETTPSKLSFWKIVVLPYKLLWKDYPTITLEQCKKWNSNKKELDKTFMELRSLSYNLGIGTWGRIKLQTFFMFLAVIFYISSILLSH